MGADNIQKKNFRGVLPCLAYEGEGLILLFSLWLLQSFGNCKVLFHSNIASCSLLHSTGIGSLTSFDTSANTTENALGYIY